MGRSAKYIDTARRAVGRMSRTIDDLAGHGALAVETDEQPVDLSRLAETLVEDNFSSAAAKGVGVATVPGLQPVMVQGVDVAAVLRAADNFMTNAVRLAPRGSQILIDCGEFDGWGWLAVSDEGPGLASQHHGRVFERGWQGAHDRDRRGGSGLGLTIARQLTEAQGGRTTIESEEGGGATFALWLPIDPDADPESIVASDRIHPVMSPWAAAAQIV
jgi:signal transduction histidine kinase